MAQSRVARIRRLVAQHSPYRVSDRQIRRVVSVLPNPRKKHRASLDRALAAIVALPYRLEPR